jgi:hypothetical protein
VSLKYEDPAGEDKDALARANEAFDGRTGFNVKAPGLGCPKLQYPPYLPAVPGYQVPGIGNEGVAMTERIWEWNERWVASRAGMS